MFVLARVISHINAVSNNVSCRIVEVMVEVDIVLEWNYSTDALVTIRAVVVKVEDG